MAKKRDIGKLVPRRLTAAAVRKLLTTMNYDEAKRQQGDLYRACKEASQALQRYPRNGIGLVSDEIRTSQAYQGHKAAYNAAFAKLRQFNAWFVKAFQSKSRKHNIL